MLWILLLVIPDDVIAKVIETQKAEIELMEKVIKQETDLKQLEEWEQQLQKAKSDPTYISVIGFRSTDRMAGRIMKFIDVGNDTPNGRRVSI